VSGINDRKRAPLGRQTPFLYCSLDQFSVTIREARQGPAATLERFRLIRPHLEDGISLIRIATGVGVSRRTPELWAGAHVLPVWRAAGPGRLDSAGGEQPEVLEG
jgi:hypothetical protein